jgi:hypothetical protein
MPRKTILLLCCLLGTWAAQAQPVAPTTAAPWALLTIADGDVTVLRGRMRFTAAEGQRLEPQDIVHTAGDARVARLEFGDGQVLDLGPATQVLLQAQGAAWPKERAATAYVARGWAKLRAPRGAAAPASAGLASATLDIAPAEGGTVLARIEAQAAFAYVESGRAALLEYRGGLAPRGLSIGEGQAYSRAAGGDGALARPTPAQLGATPRALADSLPLRAALWQNRASPLPDAMQAAQAGDTAPWMDSEPALRATMRARFADAPTGQHARHAQFAAAKPARRAVAKAAAPARVALLAPTRLNAAARAAPERLALSGGLVAERLAEPTLPSSPAAAPARRTQARAIVEL